jgi:uncharacterized protein (DUF433 family)
LTKEKVEYTLIYKHLGIKAFEKEKLHPIHGVEKSMTQTTEHCYIIKDNQILGGEPIIKGTRTPVRAIVETWRLGVMPEEIPKRLPHLTLAQIFDALSYYSDHQDEINTYIEQNRIPQELLDPIVKNYESSLC